MPFANLVADVPKSLAGTPTPWGPSPFQHPQYYEGRGHPLPNIPQAQSTEWCNAAQVAGSFSSSSCRRGEGGLMQPPASGAVRRRQRRSHRPLKPCSQSVQLCPWLHRTSSGASDPWTWQSASYLHQVPSVALSSSDGSISEVVLEARVTIMGSLASISAGEAMTTGCGQETH